MSFYKKCALGVVSLGVISCGADATGAVTQPPATVVAVHTHAASGSVLNVDKSRVHAQVHTHAASGSVLNVDKPRVHAQVHTHAASGSVLNVKASILPKKGDSLHLPS